jgi:polyribonucleotide nucleotidyltransferase
MNEVLMDQNEVVKYKGEGTAIEQQAVALVVVDEESRAVAADMRERARQFKKNVEAKFAPAIESAYKAHRDICALKNEVIRPADSVIKIVEKKASDYQLEQDRIRREAQAKIDAEIAAKERAERERLMKLAEKQMEAGRLEKAEETMQRAEEVFIPAPVLPSIDKRVVTEAGGTTSIKDFDVVVTDSLTVLREVVAGRLPIGCIDIKATVIKTHAKMQIVNGKLPVIPGCQLTEKYKFSGRAAAASSN